MLRALKKKYEEVLCFMEKYAECERIWEEDGTLKVQAVADTPWHRDVVECEIEATDGSTPADVHVYIRVRVMPQIHVHFPIKGFPL